MRTLRRLAFLLLLLPLLPTTHADCRVRNSKTVQKEQREAKRRLEQTRGKIRMNEQDLRRGVAQFESLSAEIGATDLRISALQKRVDSVSVRARAMADSVKVTQARVEALRKSYAEALRSIRRQRQLSSATAFIFSARSFTEARKRMRYLRELSSWEAEKADDLKEEAKVLSARKAELDSTRTRLRAGLKSLEVEKSKLVSARTESNILIDRLKHQGSRLERILRQQQAQAQRLDRELDRIIEEEARQAAEAERKRRIAEEKAAAARLAAENAAKMSKKGKKTTAKPKPAQTAPEPRKAVAPKATPAGPVASTFAQAKGRLPMPVSGPAMIVSDFGRHTHKDFSKVEVQNNGIDIETTPGSSALAVFPGTVSMIISMDGYHNVVLVRHGDYITVYAGIANLAVRKGETVEAGQSLGLLFSDPSDDRRTRLHFEVRHEKDKLNPAEWLR